MRREIDIANAQDSDLCLFFSSSLLEVLLGKREKKKRTLTFEADGWCGDRQNHFLGEDFFFEIHPEEGRDAVHCDREQKLTMMISFLDNNGPPGYVLYRLPSS